MAQKSTHGSKTPRGQWQCWLLACPRRPQGSHEETNIMCEADGVALVEKGKVMLD